MWMSLPTVYAALLIGAVILATAVCGGEPESGDVQRVPGMGQRELSGATPEPATVEPQQAQDRSTIYRYSGGPRGRRHNH